MPQRGAPGSQSRMGGQCSVTRSRPPEWGRLHNTAAGGGPEARAVEPEGPGHWPWSASCSVYRSDFTSKGRIGLMFLRKNALWAARLPTAGSSEPVMKSLWKPGPERGARPAAQVWGARRSGAGLASHSWGWRQAADVPRDVPSFARTRVCSHRGSPVGRPRGARLGSVGTAGV